MTGPRTTPLSEVQTRLAQLMGEAMQRGDEDPKVYVIDRYGGRSPVGEIRLDWQPETMEEAEADVRHPVIEFLPPEEFTG